MPLVYPTEDAIVNRTLDQKPDMDTKGSLPNSPKPKGTTLTPAELDFYDPNAQDPKGSGSGSKNGKTPDYNNEEGGDTLKCGYGRCTPRLLQRCNNPKAFLVFLSCFCIVQGKFRVLCLVPVLCLKGQMHHWDNLG